MRSRAPEYAGSSELPTSENPRTLAAISGEPVATASASTAPPPSPAPVTVPRLPGTPDLTSDGLYVFSGGGLELAVDPRSGNAVRLTLDGKQAIVAPEPHVDAYAGAAVEGSTLVLKASSEGLTKRFRLDTARRCVEVSYTISNASPRALRGASADFYRVASAAGLTFFPGGQKLLPGSTLRLNVWQPVVWFAHDQVREPKTLEGSVESSEGWVASVNDAWVLVKVLSDPSKATISLTSAYDASTSQRPWVEVGTRAALELAPGASATTTVRWFLRKLPSTISARPGNQELVAFVRGIIQ